MTEPSGVPVATVVRAEVTADDTSRGFRWESSPGSWGGMGFLMFVGGIVMYAMMPGQESVAATSILVGAGMIVRAYTLRFNKPLTGILIGVMLAIAAWWAFVLGMHMITYVFAGVLGMLAFNQYTRYREGKAARRTEEEEVLRVEAIAVHQGQGQGQGHHQNHQTPAPDF